MLEDLSFLSNVFRNISKLVWHMWNHFPVAYLNLTISFSSSSFTISAHVRESGRGNRLLDNSLHPVRSAAIGAASLGSKPALRMSASLWSFHLVLGLPTGRRPSGSASNICLTSRSDDILSTWPRHRSWDFSTQRSSGSILMASLIQVFLIWSIRVTPKILRRNRISAACTRDLVLSVIIQDSWP